MEKKRVDGVQVEGASRSRGCASREGVRVVKECE